jgi:hypothetical protein
VPGLVTVEAFEGGGQVRACNVDDQRYEAVPSGFLVTVEGGTALPGG